MTAEADEVRIHGVVAVLRHGDDQTTAAAAAEHAGFEIVRVLPLLLTGGVRGEHVLHALPCGFVNQRLVAAGVLDASVRHFAPVVRRGENFVQGVVLDGPGGRARCWSGCQATAFEFGSEILECPVAGRVGGEGPGDQRGTVRVNLDCPDFAAVFGDDTDIAVAERGLAWCATDLGLLFHAFDDFKSEIAAVELGDRAHDAVQQHA
nr:hypothetical protein [Mycolicibacterium agri]